MTQPFCNQKSPIGKRRACGYQKQHCGNQRRQTDSRCQKRRIAGDAFILRKQQTEKANQTIQRNRYFYGKCIAPWTALPRVQAEARPGSFHTSVRPRRRFQGSSSEKSCTQTNISRPASRNNALQTAAIKSQMIVPSQTR